GGSAARETGPGHEPAVFSNALRLTCGEWCFVACVVVIFVSLAPLLWKKFETFTIEPDYRVPHDLSNDYWLYGRFSELAGDRYDTVLLGDSVIWGEYVTRQGTLSHFLNEAIGKESCGNLGLDGVHPLALEGLIRHSASSIVNKRVLVQCNPLWISSPRADLR